MPKPSTPSVWASGKSFAFQPSLAQQAQGFDYIASVRPGTGAPITDDHDWPLNNITTAVSWIMDQLPDGGLKYGCPLVGSLIQWPLQQMPHEIWPDCGMVFIPYISQAFDKVRFPLLGQIHPSGVLPADMRGEFSRGWDNGRGVDPGRSLMSAQGFAMQNITGSISAFGETVSSAPFTAGTGVFSIGPVDKATIAAQAGVANQRSSVINFDASKLASTAPETRSRSIAWNMIVRAA